MAGPAKLGFLKEPIKLFREIIKYIIAEGNDTGKSWDYLFTAVETSGKGNNLFLINHLKPEQYRMYHLAKDLFIGKPKYMGYILDTPDIGDGTSLESEVEDLASVGELFDNYKYVTDKFEEVIRLARAKNDISHVPRYTTDMSKSDLIREVAQTVFSPKKEYGESVIFNSTEYTDLKSCVANYYFSTRKITSKIVQDNVHVILSAKARSSLRRYWSITPGKFFLTNIVVNKESKESFEWVAKFIDKAIECSLAPIFLDTETVVDLIELSNGNYAEMEAGWTTKMDHDISNAMDRLDKIDMEIYTMYGAGGNKNDILVPTVNQALVSNIEDIMIHQPNADSIPFKHTVSSITSPIAMGRFALNTLNIDHLNIMKELTISRKYPYVTVYSSKHDTYFVLDVLEMRIVCYYNDNSFKWMKNYSEIMNAINLHITESKENTNDK